MAIDLQTLIDDDPMAGFSDSMFTSRNIESVKLPSGDTYIFWVSQNPNEGSSLYEMSQYSGGESRTVAKSAVSSSGNKLPKGIRTLAGCVVKNAVNSKAGLKWIGYKNGTSIPAQVNPFFEVILPKISYDPLKNRIDLFFWTHLTSSSYSIANLAIQKPDGSFYTGKQDGGNVPEVSTVLCHAVGTFTKASVDATLMNSGSSEYNQREQIEYVPLFDQPVIVSDGKDVGTTITDLAGVSENSYLPFDVKKYKVGNEEGFCSYLPSGFWKRNNTKVYQSQIPIGNAVIYEKSHWRKFTPAWVDATGEIPVEEGKPNDYHNLKITQKAEVWMWLTPVNVSESDLYPWYKAFSDPIYNESEPESPSDARASLNIGSQNDTSTTPFQSATDFGVSVHVATLYKDSGSNVFIQQLYHGIRQDFTDSVKVDTEDSISDEPTSSLEKYTVLDPDSGINEEFIRIIGIDDTASEGDSNITPSASPSDLSFIVRQANAVKYIPVTGTSGTLIGNSSTKAITEITPQLYNAGSGTSTAHKITGFSIQDDKLVISYTEVPVGGGGDSFTGKTLEFDGIYENSYVGTKDVSPDRHLENAIVGTDTNAIPQLSYFKPQFLSVADENASSSDVNSVVGFAIEDNKLILKYAKKTPSGGGEGTSSSKYTVEIKEEGGLPQWGISSWDKESDKFIFHLKRLDTNKSQDTVVSQNYLPYDVVVTDQKPYIYAPVWRRNGVDIPLDVGTTLGAASNGKHELLMGESTEVEVWAKLKTEAPSSFISPIPFESEHISGSFEDPTFDEWYGTQETLSDFYLITYDGMHFYNETETPEYQHFEYVNALTVLRSIEFMTENLSLSINSFITNTEGEFYQGADQWISFLTQFFYSVADTFNDLIYDLNDSDDETFNLYKYIDWEAYPGQNAYRYSHVFSKNDVISTYGGSSLTAKQFLIYLKSMANEMDALNAYHADETYVFTQLKTLIVDSGLYQKARDAQSFLIDGSLASNFETLKTEVYSQHLYLLSGSTAHYPDPGDMPENLVMMGETPFNYTFISDLKTAIEDYIATPLQSKETALIASIKKVLDNDFSSTSTRENNPYLQYCIPMSLPYYCNFYPTESLTSLQESRTVKSVGLGDSSSTASNEFEYVKALINKLAYCYSYISSFFNKIQAFYSVISDLEESRTKILGVMSTIYSTRPTGTIQTVHGCGGGVKTLTGSDEIGTWVKDHNTGLVYYAAVNGGCFYTPDVSLMISKARPSERNVKNGSGLVENMTTFVMKPDGRQKLPRSPFSTTDSRLLGGRRLEDYNVVDKNGVRLKFPYQDLSEKTAANLSREAQFSIENMNNSTLNDILKNMVDRNKQYNPVDLKSKITEELNKSDKMKSVMELIKDSNAKVTLGEKDFVCLSYAVSGTPNAAWVDPVKTEVFRTSTQSFKIQVRNKNPNNLTENDSFYVLEKIIGEGVDLGVNINGPNPVGTIDENNPPAFITYEYSFDWVVNPKDAARAEKTPLGSGSPIDLVAVFSETNKSHPVYIVTDPVFLKNQKVAFLTATRTKPKFTDKIIQTNTPVIYSSTNGEILVKKVESDTKYPAYTFKNWTINGSIVTPTTVDGWSVFTINEKQTLTAVYEEARQTIIYDVTPEGSGTVINSPSEVTKGQGFTITCQANTHTKEGYKWVFEKWDCMTPGLTPFNGYSTSTSQTASVTGINTEDETISFRATFKEVKNVDPPQDGYYKVAISVEGGDESCSASVTGNSFEFPINTSCSLFTNCDYGTSTFSSWSCAGAGSSFTFPSSLNTDFTGTESMTYIIKANWAFSGKSTFTFTTTPSTAFNNGCGIKVSAKETISGNTVVLCSGTNLINQAIYDPAIYSEMMVEKIESTRFSFLKFDPDPGIALNTWFTPDGKNVTCNAEFSETPKSTLNVLVKYTVKKTDEGSTNYVLDNTLNITKYENKIDVFEDIAASVNLSTPAAYTDCSVKGSHLQDGTYKYGYYQYAFDKYEALPVNGTRSGTFGGDTPEYSETPDSTASIPWETAKTFINSEPSATLQYGVYLIRTFVESPLPEDISSTVTINFDKTVFRITPKTLSIPNFTLEVTPWELNESGDSWSANIKNGARISIEAEIISDYYSWDSYSKWTLNTANGNTVSTDKILSATVTGDVTYVPTATPNKFGTFYVKTSPDDANAKATITRANGYNGPLVIDGEDVAVDSNYTTRFRYPVGKSFTITKANSNLNYVFDKFIDNDTGQEIAMPFTVSEETVTHINCQYKRKNVDVPITYSIKATKSGESEGTVYQGNTCSYGFITGPSSVNAYEGTFDVKATANTSVGNTVEFLAFDVISTKKDGTTTTLYSNDPANPRSIQPSTDYSSISVQASFLYENDTTPPEYEDKTVKVSIEPSYDYGSVSLTCSGVKSGTANASGSAFTVSNGSSISLVASVKDSSYVFKKWNITRPSGRESSSGNTYTATITENLAAVAVFEKQETDPKSNGGSGGGSGGGTKPDETEDPKETDMLDVFITAGEGGEVYPDSKTVNPNSTLIVKARAKQGYMFSRWSDGSSSGKGSTGEISRTFVITEDTNITAYFELVDKVVPPMPVTSSDTASGIYDSQSIIPWYAPRDTTKLEIIFSEDTSGFSKEIQDSALLHIAHVSYSLEGTVKKFQISQYFHGERVDYIDYGDADCLWNDAEKGFRSIVFNDGSSGSTESDTNRKPARLYQFDTLENEEFPERPVEEDSENTDWEKYGILARKKHDKDSLSQGADLVYLKVPALKNLETDNVSIDTVETEESGVKKSTLQIHDFQEEAVEVGLADLLSVDKDTGKLVISDNASNYNILIRIKGDKNIIGYMSLSKKSDNDEKDTSEDPCENHPDGGDGVPGGNGGVAGGNDGSNGGVSAGGDGTEEDGCAGQCNC